MFRLRNRKGNLRNHFKHKPVMKILHISDTHNHHRQLQDLPAADVIVHSGDFTMVGTEAEVIDFMEWFCALPYKHKVFIAGNHDDCLFGADINGLPENCHYLYGNGVTIEGIKFFGIPMFVEDDISGNYTKMLENIITAKPKAHAFKNEMCFPLTKTKCELKKHPNSKFECFFNDFNRTRTSLFLPFPSKLIQDNLVCVLELQE